jgi:hypothetical protein
MSINDMKIRIPSKLKMKSSENSTINAKSIPSEISIPMKPLIQSPGVQSIANLTVDRISTNVLPPVISSPKVHSSPSMNLPEIALPSKPIRATPDIPSPVIISSDDLNIGFISSPELPEKSLI